MSLRMIISGLIQPPSSDTPDTNNRVYAGARLDAQPTDAQADLALSHITARFVAGQNSAATLLTGQNLAAPPHNDEPNNCFQTVGGSWRRRAGDEHPRFYRDGEDISNTTRFDNEFYNPADGGRWVRLNARGALSHQSAFEGKPRPDGVSDFDWQGWDRVDVAQVPAEYTTEGQTVVLPNDGKPIDANRALRNYLDQHFRTPGMWGDNINNMFESAKTAGVKVESFEVQEAGANSVVTVRISSEDLAKLRTIQAEEEQKVARDMQAADKGREETNQMFLDLGRVVWNSGVNIVEGATNTVIDAARSEGGLRPIVVTPYDPLHVDISGAKSPYRSEMMNRDVEGKVNPGGVTRGKVTEMGVTIVAPFVIGAAIAPEAAPQTLRSLGALPEETIAATQTTQAVYKGVEITDSRGSAIGEFDGVEGNLFVEEKSAQGLSVLNPKTGTPFQTPESWAQKQIFNKTVTRIENLAKATNTRPTIDGSAIVPRLSKIKNIRHLEFRIENSTPELQKAVAQQIQLLQGKYPDWGFSVKYGR